MFGISATVGGSVAILNARLEDARLFKAYCESIPPEVAAGLRSERKRRQEAAEQHQRNLEVAREGRSLNFWGNR